MSVLEYFKIAWGNLIHRKKRAYLTIVGIFIGIMAVVALVSLGQGLQQGVNAEFAKLGVDKVFIQPSSTFGGSSASAPAPITDTDLREVRAVNGIKEVAAVNERSVIVSWGDEVQFPTAISIPSDDRERELVIQSFQAEVDTGRMLSKQDSYKAVVGSDYASRAAFQKPLSLGSKILINNVSFTVIGFLKSTGTAANDRTVMIPSVVYTQVIATKNNYDMLIARAQLGVPAVTIADRVKEKLRQSRNVKAGDEDFSVQTSDDLQASADKILGIIQVVLTGIALISLVVGAVGITNTMYTAVLERTKEIGIMKAVGARNEAILSIFIIESGLLGLFGGLVGLGLGLLIAYVTSIIALQALGQNLIQFYVSWWLIAGALLFGFVIGALAGSLPAKQAADMKPVDSLRYE